MYIVYYINNQSVQQQVVVWHKFCARLIFGQEQWLSAVKAKLTAAICSVTFTVQMWEW